MAESSKCAGASPVVDCYIKLPSGRTISMDMLPGDKVQNIYRKVATEEGVPEDRVTIKYTGKVLNKTHTVGYLGVCAETILKAEILQVKQYTIYVKLPTGRTVSLEVENVSPIRFIKDLIFTTESIPVNQQTLKSGDRILSKPNERLVDAGLSNEAVLVLEISEKPTKKRTSPTKSRTRRGSIDSSGSISDSDGESTRDAEDRDRNTTKGNEVDLDEDDKEAVMNTFDARGRSVEIVFSFDTTGSMYSCLDKVRQKLKESVERLIQHIPTIRIGIIAHGDYCDYNNYVLRMVDLTSNVDELVDFVRDVPSTGGGDTPECYEWALHKAVYMDWSEDSAKALVAIGDCLPHPPSYTDQAINWHNELDLLKGMGVKVYGVKALNQTDALPFYQELADRTGGAFISFQNFDIIAEMFLAVCYREASDEQFEAYREEIAQSEGQEGDEVKQEQSTKVKDIQNILSQLDEQKNKTAEDKPTRYVAESWWDPQLDDGSPGYAYDSAKDSWSSCSGRRDRAPPATTSSSSASPSGPRSKTTRMSIKRRISLRFGRRPSKKTTVETSVSGDAESSTKPATKAANKKGCSVM